MGWLKYFCVCYLQADKEKKTKKKKAAKDDTPAETPTPSEAPAETPASAATPSDSQRGSTRGSSSRRAKKAPSSVFVLFSQKQIAEFKEVTPHLIDIIWIDVDKIFCIVRLSN